MRTKFDISDKMKKKNSGGARQGSGRKPLYGEPTTPVQFECPVSKKDEFKANARLLLAEYTVRRKTEKILVEKYGAKDSGRSYGRSFIQGITFWEFPQYPGVHVCYGVDNDGDLETKRNLFTARYENDGVVATMLFSPEFILNTTGDPFLEIINDLIKTCQPVRAVPGS